jgi:hypothetical protein
MRQFLCRAFSTGYQVEQDPQALPGAVEFQGFTPLF